MKIDRHSPPTHPRAVKHHRDGPSRGPKRFLRAVIAITAAGLIAAIVSWAPSGNSPKNPGSRSAGGQSKSEPTALAAARQSRVDRAARPEAGSDGPPKRHISPVRKGAKIVSAKAPADPSSDVASAATVVEHSQPQAVHLLRQVLSVLVHGPAFDAKVRQTVWTTGRKVVGVGTYEQSGGGSGRFNLQLTMHDGDGKHRMQQISDGRLAWTRTEISGDVSLRRVDVGRLEECVRGAAGNMPVAPRLKVGGWAELLSTFERDYVLGVVGMRLKDQPLAVITGKLAQDRRQDILRKSARADWPPLYPTRVRVAVQTEPDSQTGFGQLLPVRIEFRSDPVVTAADAKPAARHAAGRLIALIELYSIRPISPPPAERFRFENQEAEVNFINETDRYIEMYGVRLTQRTRWQLQR